MSNDTIRRLLQAPTTTLAQARRVLDAIKGTLAPAKPADDAEEPLKMFGGKTASEVLRRAAAGESFLDQLTCAAGHVPYHKQPGGSAATAEPATPQQKARIATLEKAIAQKEAKLAGLRDRIATLESRKAGKATATARSAQKTAAMMDRRAAASAPAPAVVARPLADASPARLSMLISHPSATAADRAAAIAEAALRPGVTIYSDGRTSVSSRGGRSHKAANRKA